MSISRMKEELHQRLWAAQERHKSFVTTLRYAHLAPELRQEAVERLCGGNEWTLFGHQGLPAGGPPLRPAANDGTPKGFGDPSVTLGEPRW